MDLVYMPEVLTYGSLRAPIYRDYEQPWNKDYFNYGKSTSSVYCPRAQQTQRSSTQTSKDNCHLCKESKRRSLAAYIRGKTRLNSCSEINEEDESQAPERIVDKETESRVCKTQKQSLIRSSTNIVETKQ